MPSLTPSFDEMPFKVTHTKEHRALSFVEYVLRHFALICTIKTCIPIISITIEIIFKIVRGNVLEEIINSAISSSWSCNYLKLMSQMNQQHKSINNHLFIYRSRALCWGSSNGYANNYWELWTWRSTDAPCDERLTNRSSSFFTFLSWCSVLKTCRLSLLFLHGAFSLHGAFCFYL